MHILIINHHHIGDVICSTSLVYGIRARYPDAMISMFVRSPAIQDLFAPGLIDRFVIYPKRRIQAVGTIATLSRPRVDLLLCTTELSHSWFVSLLCLLIRPRRVVCESTIKFLLSKGIRVPFDYSLHKFESNQRLGEAIGVELPYPRPRVHVSPAAAATAAEMLPDPENDSWDRLRVGIAPGCHSLSHKAWPPEKFAELISRMLAKEFARPVLFGSAQEIPLAEEILNQVPLPLRDRCVSFVGKLSLAECAASLDRCDMVLANDSGLAHMASGLGKPIAAIFGPTPAHRCGPYQATRIIHNALPCAPCYPASHNGCGLPRCIQDVTVEQVFRALTEIRDEIQPLGSRDFKDAGAWPELLNPCDARAS